MPRWPTKPLGELCELINGRAFKPSEWGKDGLRIVRIQNLNDHEKPFNFYSGEYRDVHRIDNGAILLSWSGTPGTSFGCFRWSRGPGLLNQHIFKVLVDDSAIDGDFFIHAVNSKLEEMIGQAHGGVGLRHITKGKLEAIQLPVPSLDQQRRIVSRIKKCLSRVEEITNLRSEALRERDCLLDSVIEAEFRAVDGPIVSLVEVCSLGSPLVDPRESKYREMLHVGGANIETATGRISDLKTAGEERLKSAKFTFDKRMVLYNKIRPYLKKVARPTFSGLCSADMYPLLPINRRMLRDYLFYLLLSRSFTRYAIDGSNRAGMPKVNREHLFAYSFPLPSLDVQERVAHSLDSALSVVSELRGYMQVTDAECSSLRKSILRKAFAGGL